jgi:hypothetical protein
MIKQIVLIVLIVCLHNNYMAQRIDFFPKEKSYSHPVEYVFGLGATNFLGDLGGANKVGTDYSLSDIDFPSTGVGMTFSYRYRLHPFYASTTNLEFSIIRSDDSETLEIIRNSRNLHFRSNTFKLTQRFDIILLEFKIKRSQTKHQFYLYSGLGLMYFNPKAKYKQEWVSLRPLHTEGQGLEGGPKKYLPVTMTIPFGIGYKMFLNRKWSIGIEATYTKTFSDYIDDVGGIYYDPSKLLNLYGEQSAYFSNPSNKNQNWFSPGQQRGDKNKDAILNLNFTVGISIR